MSKNILQECREMLIMYNEETGGNEAIVNLLKKVDEQINSSKTYLINCNFYCYVSDAEKFINHYALVIKASEEIPDFPELIYQQLLLNGFGFTETYYNEGRKVTKNEVVIERGKKEFKEHLEFTVQII